LWPLSCTCNVHNFRVRATYTTFVYVQCTHSHNLIKDPSRAQRHLAAEACPYANICEQCDNYTTSSEFLPQIQAQIDDEAALRDDALARGWGSEVARHARVIASLQRHLDQLKL
jgi:hypothetical protein